MMLESLPDGRFVTGWEGRSGVHIHSPDLKLRQVFLPTSIKSSRYTWAAVAPRRGLVAIYADLGPVCVWEISSGRLLFELERPEFGPGFALAFDDSEQYLAAMDNWLHILDITGREPVRQIKLSDDRLSRPRCLVWSPNAREIWVAGRDKKFTAYRVADLKPVQNHPLSDSKVTFIQKSPDGRQVMVAMVEEEVRIYNLNDWSLAHSWTLEPKSDIQACAWSPDQTQLSVVNRDRVEIWSIAKERRLCQHKNGKRVAWSRDGKTLLSLRHYLDGCQRINADTLQAESFQLGTNSSPGSMTGDSMSFQAGIVGRTGGGAFTVWDLESGQLLNRFPVRDLTYPAILSNAGDRLLLSSYEKKTYIADATSGRDLLKMQGVLGAWSPDDSKLFILADDGTCRILNSRTGEADQVFEIARGNETSVSWSADGTRVAMQVLRSQGNSDLHVWDVRTAKLSSRTDFPAESRRGQPKVCPLWTADNRLLVAFQPHVYEVSADNLAESRTWGSATNRLNGLAHSFHSGSTLLIDEYSFKILDRDGKLTAEVIRTRWGPAEAHPDGRRFVTPQFHYYDEPSRGFDIETMQDLGCQFPFIGERGWLTIGPTGHYQGSEGIESEIRYVAEHLDGRQQTYTAEEFASVFRWKNDPQRATFLKLVDTLDVAPRSTSAGQ